MATPRGGGSTALSSCSSKNVVQKCPVCCKKIDDNLQESIQCECSSHDGPIWLHRCCAGLTKDVFSLVSKSSRPFYCLVCRITKLCSHDNEVNQLKTSLDDLRQQLATVSQNLADLKNKCLPHVSHDVPQVSETVEDVGACSNVLDLGIHSTRPRTSSTSASDARKFNVVVFGIAEHPRGTNRIERCRQDLESISDLFTETDETFNPLSIRDHFRLGKYSPDSVRRRPLLVKLNRSSDVQLLLSKRNVLNAPYRLKPDLSPEDRAVQSILMKERFSLIEAGADRQSIRVSKTSIFINRRLYGKVINGSFQRHPTLIDSVPVLSNLSPSNNTEVSNTLTPLMVSTDTDSVFSNSDAVHKLSIHDAVASNATDQSSSTTQSSAGLKPASNL